MGTAVLVTALATGLCSLIHPQLEEANLVMLFLLGVMRNLSPAS